MTSQIIQVEPFDLVVFGGTGDLAYRKLFPALYHRDKSGQFSDPTRIIGVSRREMSREEFQTSVREAVAKFGGAKDGAALEKFIERIHYQPLDATGKKGW